MRLTRLLRLALRVLAALVVVLMITPLAWRVVSGDIYVTVTGVSMSPTYERGDVLVVRGPDGDELTRVGQVVLATFSETSGGAETRYVHRVHTITDDGAILQGDGNEGPDPAPITQAQVIGVPRLHLSGAQAEAFAFSETLLARVCGVSAALLLLWSASAMRHRATDGGEDGSEVTTHQGRVPLDRSQPQTTA